MNLTHTQYDALQRLTRAKDSASSRACRDILVNGARPVDAAKAHGLAEQSCRNSLQALRRAWKLVQAAAGTPQ